MSTLRDAMSHAALGWVKPELDETLRQVRNEVEYYVEDPADGSRMRFCAGYLHQVQGTLRMVELYAPAMVAEELEQLANAIGAGDVPDRDEACATLMRGSVLLPDYLERLQNGHRDIPIVLLPLLNDIRSARAAPGINESVLFAFAPDSASATEAELDHARGSLSGRNRELLDTVGNAVKEELLRIKDALDLHLRTGGAPVQLQTQVNELGAVADTLGMMGLGVARGVVVQQRDALREVVEGVQQIDETLLLDIAGALLYVDASLDDQVAHLGAGGSGEDDPSAVENRRTVEVLAHEAIANFAAAREHFVAFIETNWNHQQLQEVPRLLGEVAGALRMLDLSAPADYLQGVRQYIAVELLGKQRVPSGRQLDTLADAMASLEYYLEALRERRPGRDDILDITRNSLETLRYWPLPDANQPTADTGPESLPVAPEPIELTPWDAPAPEPIELAVTAEVPRPANLPPPLPDFTFDPPPAAAAPVTPPPVALVFDASTAPVSADAPQWTLGQQDDADEGLTFAHLDPVIADLPPGAAWGVASLPPALQADRMGDDVADATLEMPAFVATGAGFDPVAAEHELLALSDEPIEFTFDDGLRNADDVLSLQVDDTDTGTGTGTGIDTDTDTDTDTDIDSDSDNIDAGAAASSSVTPGEVDVQALPTFLQEIPVASAQDSAAPPLDPFADDVDTAEAAADAAQPNATVRDAVIGRIELDDAATRFLAELDAAAAQFRPEGPDTGTVPTAAAAESPAMVASADDISIEAGFEDDGENIDQDIREVFIEEFDEELVNLGNLLPAWRAAPDNLDRLRPIRRVFHTLKGSGRLVGARTLGEFSWKIEGMLNRVLDGSRPASPAVVALVGQAYDALPQLNAALRDGSRVTADLQAIQAIADRVAAGEETFHVPLQRAVSTAVRTVMEIVAAEAAPVIESTPANIDSVLREILEAEVEVHQATLQAWLDAAADAPQPVTDGLLRAVHTMNGAFAMTDVPEITAVTGAAESYLKRSLAADALPAAAGMDALAETCAAITTTMAALQDEAPRVPVQTALAARLVALADTLPEARWPALAEDDLDLEHDELPVQAADAAGTDALDEATDAGETAEAYAAEPGQFAPVADAQTDAVEVIGDEVEDDAAPVLARADDTTGIDELEAEIDADGLSVIGSSHAVAPANDDDALIAMELTGTDDLSAYFDAELPDSTHAADAQAASDAVAEDTDPAAMHAGLESAELTAAEDLSRYFDQLAEPTPPASQDDAEAETKADADAPADAQADTQADPAAARPVGPDGPAADTSADAPVPGSVYAASVDDAANDNWSYGEQDSEQHGEQHGEQSSDESSDEDSDEDAQALSDVLPPPPAFGEVVDAQQAMDDGLTVVDAPDALDTRVLGLDATDENTGEADAFADVIETTAPDTSADATTPARFFELEDAPAASLTHDPEPADVLAAASADSDDLGPGDALDFTQLDQELVDIFVEEGKDLLDHCDGLISELRAAPQDRDVIAGLQRDLHTLKGGARMAGINPIGDLGHGIESLLEAVAANRTDIDRSDVHLLERGFDRLHQLLTRTGQHRTVAMPDDLIAAFEQRTQGRIAPAPADTANDALPSGDARVEAAIAALVAAPLSAPVPLETVSEEDGLPRPQQEQVRVRADLLDRLVNHAGEVAIYRSRLEQQLGAFRGAMGELDRTNARLRDQLRRLDLETEAQIVARYQREQDQAHHTFDPLELDRFSTLQQLSRALNESAADLGGLQGVLDDLSRQYDVLLQQQSRVSSELQDGLMRARMVPFDGLVPRLRRVVRQAGQDTGKQVHVTLEGTHGELDRNVLDRMVAPLEHMLRNSVAHGLETPEQRRAAGKPEEGEIAIRLRREGSEIVLEVADDGAGLDRGAIRRRAEQRGLIAADAVLGDAELDAMIFSPGFSTADQVSQLAGRGVGMDVVHNEVRQLGGSVDIHSVSGQGVTFTLRLPQTLAVTQAVFVQIGETTFAVPVASVSGIGRISRERFETANGGYHYGGEEFALHDLGTLIGQAQARAEGQAQVPLLLVRAGDLRVAVAIDQVLGNREIVVKPVGLQIASVPGIYGATITGDGRVVVILDVAPLVRRYLANPHKPITATAKVSDRDVPLVMVVDDSLTMRKVTGRILERHNFEVTVARDGIEALERLDERVPDLMLLDIEMPRMDGYELASVMRADPRYQGVPIVMITSRSGDKHRQRAFELGVQRYLGKPYQELDLMRNVYDLLGIARARE
ncbi:Hpt domain-containing protein [Stenotrophomonas sp. Ste96]|uniref:Hpt domain-containing protein n=1 Tax=Stenotrophomonas sp. Ste96 TaxID=2926029 RepID=UPI0021C86B22|nr:Hpt domain-containing protein [Stenotrophomonas sp. Ste96]